MGASGCRTYLFTYILKSEYTKATLEAFWKIFAWSINALLEGLTPAVDYDGRAIAAAQEPLADGWRGCLCHIRGDWQWYCEIFAFPSWVGAERMCWLCLVQRSQWGGALLTDYNLRN